jgi:hypothetical protein
MSISQTLVIRFFKLFSERRFAEAERVLERLSQRADKNELNKGYIQALYGLFISKKSSNDRYAFLSNINVEEKKELKTHQDEFLKYANDNFHAEYDRGFFLAWAEYVRFLLKKK